MERKRKTAASISKELLEVESNPSECVINLPVEITMNICKREKKIHYRSYHQCQLFTSIICKH